MQFHINLDELKLGPEVTARISAKINSVITNEIAHIDLSKFTLIGGRLGPGTIGFIARNELQSELLGKIAELSKTQQR